MRTTAMWAAGMCWVMSAGCSTSPPADTAVAPSDSATTAADLSRASCARRSKGVGLVKDGPVRQGSAVALARDGGKLVAIVADKDAKRLSVVDLDAGAVTGSVEVGGAPEQVLLLGDGRVVATIADASHIEVLEPTGKADAPLERLCTRAVPAGGFGLAASVDGQRLAVTSAFEAALTLFEGEELALKGSASLPRSPRGVLIDDQDKAFVSHVVGANVSVVPLGSITGGAPKTRLIDTRVRAGSQDAENLDLALLRSGTQGYALASVEIPRGGGGGGEKSPVSGGPLPGPAKPKSPPPKPPELPKPPTKEPLEPPMLGRTPDGPPAALGPAAPKESSQRIIIPMVSVDPGDPARPTRLYYGPPPTAGVAKHAPVAILVDPSGEKSLSTHVLAPTSGQRSGECLMPRAMAYRQSTQKLYVTCMGVDLMLELDARAVDPMRAITRRFQIPRGPTGVAVSDERAVAVVWGQFDEQVAVIPLGGGNTKTIDAYQGNQSIDAQTALGRDLFYRSEDARITFDGVACSSCHPDGGEDGVTWSTPEGMRQTPMLAGRLHGTAPYGWTRKQGTLEEYIADTSTRLGGTGLDPESLKALAKYAKNLPTPPKSAAVTQKLESHELFDRGRDVFFAEGCGSCHLGGPGTDAKSHKVTPDGGTSYDDEFDTPSLTRIGLTAPYFHDGRYRTMDELLRDPSSKMGSTAKLSEGDRNALKIYLESL